MKRPSFLLIGPYDPHAGEYTFLSPPLGVWRLVGHLEKAGFEAEVFDPNCSDRRAADELLEILARRSWDVVGISTTGMTLAYDLSLAHLVRRSRPETVLVAGGMEATFRPELMFELAPFDLVVLGEGEHPLVELGNRLGSRASLGGIPGTAIRDDAGAVRKLPKSVLTAAELRDSILSTPYAKMPYPRYWRRLEEAYRIGALPHKAEREARLAEARAVRLNTLNYCPMGCTFCSSTNFLHVAQASTAPVARLEADDCMTMIEHIVDVQPDLRSIIFQDDIFVFTKDKRIFALCESILEAKSDGRIPKSLEFISTNRIDAMTPERLAVMKRAGFRVLGFGVESFAQPVLEEFNKGRIYPYIEPALETSLELGLTPFLDIILTSPRSGVKDLSETLLQAYRWTVKGCEVGMYPYVIPFSGAAMASDPSHESHTIYENKYIEGTDVTWRQAIKILPRDPETREAILVLEDQFERALAVVARHCVHVPSRVRSMLWILCGATVLGARSPALPAPESVLTALLARLPKLDPKDALDIRFNLLRDAA